MKKLLISLALVAGLLGAQVASAHTVSNFTATGILYGDYNHRCGEGFFWRCSNRKSDLRSTVASNRHDRNTLYCFIQVRPGKWEKKCVRATIDHHGMYVKSSYNHGLRVVDHS